MRRNLRLLQVLWRERWDLGPKVVRTPGLGCQGWDLWGRSTWADPNENLELSPHHSLQQGNAWHGALVHTENKEDRDYNRQNSQVSVSEVVWRISCLALEVQDYTAAAAMLSPVPINQQGDENGNMASHSGGGRAPLTQVLSKDKGYRIYEEPQKGFYALLGIAPVLKCYLRC